MVWGISVLVGFLSPTSEASLHVVCHNSCLELSLHTSVLYIGSVFWCVWFFFLLTSLESIYLLQLYLLGNSSVESLSGAEYSKLTSVCLPLFRNLSLSWLGVARFLIILQPKSYDFNNLLWYWVVAGSSIFWDLSFCLLSSGKDIFRSDLWLRN